MQKRRHKSWIKDIFIRFISPSFCICPLGNFLQPRNKHPQRAKAEQRVRLTRELDPMLLGLVYCWGRFPHSTFWAQSALLWADPAITWGRAWTCPVKCMLFAPNISPHGGKGVLLEASCRAQGTSGLCSRALLLGGHCGGQAAGAPLFLLLIHFCRGGWGYSSSPFPSFHPLDCSFVLFFFSLWGTESGKAFTGTLVLLQVSR